MKIKSDVIKAVLIAFVNLAISLITFAGTSIKAMTLLDVYSDPYPPPPTSSASNQTIESNHQIFLPLILESDELLYTKSYYIDTVDQAILYDLGSELGERDSITPFAQDSIVALLFGLAEHENSQYGAILHRTYQFVTTGQIANAVYHFAGGYWDHLGDDYTSKLRIAVGISNDDDGYVEYAHGAAWANMIDSVDEMICPDYPDDNPMCLQISVAGIGNMEVLFNTPENTRYWVNGFHYNTNLYFYNMGDAQGCPPYGSCDNGWTQDDIYYISWEIGRAQPLPMIYATGGANAEQWQELSLYAYGEGGVAMDIAGVTTQYWACQQMGSCSGMDNTPDDGLQQLYDELNNDPVTAQALRWVTDMWWRGVPIP